MFGNLDIGNKKETSAQPVEINESAAESLGEKKNKPLDLDDSKYSIPKETAYRYKKGDVKVGKGGDTYISSENLYATKEDIEELNEETAMLQDWVRREEGNSVAIDCLENENLKETYYKIKGGFAEYGPVVLMGFKTPQGVPIPRLKIMDKNGEVLDVLTGPSAVEELNKRALAYRNFENGYEVLPADLAETNADEVIADYTGNVEDYT